ncbi:MAG: hypothetical protein ACYTKD_12485 [Planctomycetota bacterium]
MLDLISAQTVGGGCVVDLRSLMTLGDESARKAAFRLLAGPVERKDSAHRRRRKRKRRRKLLWVI